MPGVEAGVGGGVVAQLDQEQHGEQGEGEKGGDQPAKSKSKVETLNLLKIQSWNIEIAQTYLLLESITATADKTTRHTWAPCKQFYRLDWQHFEMGV